MENWHSGEILKAPNPLQYMGIHGKNLMTSKPTKIEYRTMMLTAQREIYQVDLNRSFNKLYSQWEKITFLNK